MMRFFKNLLFIIFGFLMCYVMLVGITVHHNIRLARVYSIPHGSSDISTKEENELKNQIRELFRKGDIEALNNILRVDKGEVALIVHGPRSFLAFHTPVAEVVLKNTSERKINFFKPYVNRLTPESSSYKGYLQDEFSLNCPVALVGRCIILAPNEQFSMPVMFDVTGIGKHKVNLSIGFPIYEKISRQSSSLNQPVVARADFIFEIVEGEE